MKVLTTAFVLYAAWAVTCAKRFSNNATEEFCKTTTHCRNTDKDINYICHINSEEISRSKRALEQCESDDDCGDERSCVDSSCVDPCVGQCGLNTDCYVSGHTHYCKCMDGFTGNPIIGCSYVGRPLCQSHKQCLPDETCVDNMCIDPCEFTDCGLGANCRVYDHEITCMLMPQFSAPSIGGCLSNDDCSSNKICFSQKCVDPCSYNICGKDVDCQIKDHFISCVGKSHQGTTTSCQNDSDCPDNKSCEDDECIDLCTTNPCSKELFCVTINHVTTCRTDPPQKIRECNADADCASNKKCNQDSGLCENPCEDKSLYKPDESCEVVDHVVKIIKLKKKCKEDKDCPGDKKCDGKECYDPCKKACKDESKCKVINHEAICEKEKPPPECTTDSQCPVDKGCRSEKCINPCIRAKCKVGYECYIKKHQAYCKTIKTLQGNCTKAEDCPTDRICDGLWCRDPCEKGPCGIGEECDVEDHKVECRERPVEAECVEDNDCPDDKQCNGMACVDPCTLTLDLCKAHEECKTVDHTPTCESIPDVECIKDIDCASEKACVNWKCIDPCGKNTCGANSICKAKAHTAICLPKPEEKISCSSHSDCTSERTCIQGFCEDPCKKYCRGSPVCTVENHVFSCNGGSSKSGNCSGTIFPKPLGKKKFYAITHFKINWWGAYMWCAAHGKQLAMVENKEDNEKILKEIEKTKVDIGKFFIGGTDEGISNVWKWMPTGLPLSTRFSYWHEYRPRLNNDVLNCLEYWKWAPGIKWRWTDDYCTLANNFICQDYHMS